jgi:hypothetical protein
MNLTRYLSVLAPVLVLSACATAPGIETAVSGSLPAGASYARVDATKYFGEAIAADAVEGCLARSGMHPGTPPTALVQLAHTLRPVRSRVEPGEPAGGKRAKSDRPREELVLAVSDSASGALLLRASAARVLRKDGVAPQDGALVAALCAAMVGQEPAAGSPGTR